MIIITTTVIKLTVREKKKKSYHILDQKSSYQCSNYSAIMTLAIRKFLKCFSIFFSFIRFLLIHSCKTIYNIVFILQVILQETYTEEIRGRRKHTNCSFLQQKSQPMTVIQTVYLFVLSSHLLYRSIAWLLYSYIGYSKRIIGYQFLHELCRIGVIRFVFTSLLIISLLQIFQSRCVTPFT